jgi:hypothetical protein
MRIAVGDIIRYDREHIGIICDVDYEAMRTANSIYDLMRAVKVIESIYSGGVNYVIKRNMLMGSGTAFTDPAPQTSWHFDKNGDLRNWSIERLAKE